MAKIIITGHGKFGSGLASALKLIAGLSDHIIAVDFEDGMSSDDLLNQIKSNINAEEEVLVLTDLVGGTPFKTGASLIAFNKQIVTIGGVNLPLLIELSQMPDNTSALELAEIAKDMFSDTMDIFSAQSFKNQSTNSDNGI